MILLAVMFGNMIDSLSVGHSPVYVCTIDIDVVRVRDRVLTDRT